MSVHCSSSSSSNEARQPTLGASVSLRQCQRTYDNSKLENVDIREWFYVSPQGSWQGPFSVGQLRNWRSALPMNLWLRKLDLSESTACQNRNQDSKSDGEEWTLLASVLGDMALLTRWQHEKGLDDAASCTAPAATVFEHCLSAEATDTETETAVASHCVGLDITAAALAGLSEDDEAKRLAVFAAESGESLEGLLNFSYRAAASRHSLVNMEDANRPQEHTNVATEELQSDDLTGDQWRERRGPSGNWRRLKKRKKEENERRKNAWLFS